MADKQIKDFDAVVAPSGTDNLVTQQSSDDVTRRVTPTQILSLLGTITQAEAEAGTATTRRAFTAERVKQAVEALQRPITSQSEAEAGTENTKAMTALRTAQASDNIISLGLAMATVRSDGVADVSAALQSAIDASDVVYLPDPKYNIATASLSLVKPNFRLLGRGMDVSESSMIDPATQILYSGTGAAVNVGTDDMAATMPGLLLKDFEIMGTAAGAQGIYFRFNSSLGIMVIRSELNRVSVTGFTNGTGIRHRHGVSNKFRRTYTYGNEIGMTMEDGTLLHMDGVMSRVNTKQGLLVVYARGLAINGGSLFESNGEHGARFTLGTDQSHQIRISDSWFENNLTASGSYQLEFTGSGGIRARVVELANLEINGSAGSGHILLDFVEDAVVRNIHSNRVTGDVLKIGATTARVWHHNIVGAGGGIDPDGRAGSLSGRVVSLSGGGTATLGGVGGDGPTNAAQNSWLKVRDEDGTIRFIPVWT